MIYILIDFKLLYAMFHIHNLSVVVPPEKMFDEYLYLSSTSQQFKYHFIELANELKTDLNLRRNSVLVDIGINDGIFLEPINKLGLKAINVEYIKM